MERPEYCALGEGELRSVNAWFGPAGTVRAYRHFCHSQQCSCIKAPPLAITHQLLLLYELKP